jgi:DNA-binding CsgD family transcriptional regulator/ribosomal protein S6
MQEVSALCSVTMEQNRIFKKISEVMEILPFNLLILDIYKYKIVFPFTKEVIKREIQKINCFETYLGRQRPCHEIGLACPLEIIKKKRGMVRLEHCYGKNGDGQRVREIIAYPILNRKNEIKWAAVCSSDITTQRNLAEKLRKNESIMRHLNTELFESNKALALMAKNILSQRKNAEKRIATIISSKALPIVSKLHDDNRESAASVEFELLRMILTDLVYSVSASEVILADKLTRTEMRIASMINCGMSSEEISKSLFISVETVKTHRKNIRKKLGIQNSGTTLYAFMNSRKKDMDTCLERTFDTFF